MHILLHHPTSGEFLLNTDSVRSYYQSENRTTIYFVDGHSMQVIETIYEIYTMLGGYKQDDEQGAA